MGKELVSLVDWLSSLHAPPPPKKTGYKLTLYWEIPLNRVVAHSGTPLVLHIAWKKSSHEFFPSSSLHFLSTSSSENHQVPITIHNCSRNVWSRSPLVCGVSSQVGERLLALEAAARSHISFWNCFCFPDSKTGRKYRTWEKCDSWVARVDLFHFWRHWGAWRTSSACWADSRCRHLMTPSVGQSSRRWVWGLFWLMFRNLGAYEILFVGRWFLFESKALNWENSKFKI